MMAAQRFGLAWLATISRVLFVKKLATLHSMPTAIATNQHINTLILHK
jgi:hypothetical protein